MVWLVEKVVEKRAIDAAGGDEVAVNRVPA